MPRRGENIYKRKDGRWEARYIKGYSQSGKARYGSLYARTYKDVKIKLNEVLISNSNEERKKEIGYKNQFYLDWLEKWLNSKQKEVKYSTYNQYRNVVNNHIQPYFKDYTLNDISTERIENFKRFLLDKGNKKTSEGLSTKTVSDILAILKASFRYIHANDSNFQCSFYVTRMNTTQRTMRVLMKEEECKLTQYLINNLDRYKLGILLSLYTGIRVGELCALQGKHFLLSEKTLIIEQTVQRLQRKEHNGTYLSITSPKSSSSIRKIPLPEFFFRYEKYFNIPENHYFLSGSQKIIEPRTMQNHFKRYLKQCNVPDANYHALRHTFATRCIEADFDLKSLSEILGHSSVKITLDKYVHSSMKQKRKNMEKLNQFLIENVDLPSKI